MPVQVQLLGGDPDRMAQSAVVAVQAGAKAVDINFGCPAKTVNRHDGGASLLQHPARIRDIVQAVRRALPVNIPVSAKLRLGWDSIDAVYENAAMAAEGGAAWITIHARTKAQGYMPPVFWQPIGKVREMLGVPIVANGDIWDFDYFLRCREDTGCIHFIIGRGALANPMLPHQIAHHLGTGCGTSKFQTDGEIDWISLLRSLVGFTEYYQEFVPLRTLLRFKQWLKLAANHGDFPHFDAIKQTQTLDEFFEALAEALPQPRSGYIA